MFQLFGKFIIELLERELVKAAPEIQKLLMEQLESLIEYLAKELGVKQAALKLENKSDE